MRYLALTLALVCVSCGRIDPPPVVDEPCESTCVLPPEAEASPPVNGSHCPITLTEKAAREVKRAIADYKAEEGAPEGEMYLRARVQGGGCTGFMNKLDLDPTVNPEHDLVSESRGVKIVVDKRSALYLDGSVVDWVDTPTARGFSVKNPNGVPEK